MSVGSSPQLIEPDFRARVWGSPLVGPWFEPPSHESPDEPIGEVWFPAGDLLIKFLFTSQNLSVQVHPGDEYALLHENSRGKTEMWHILRADPGARIALGFKQRISPDQLIPAAQSGVIMDLLDWIEVHPGETYFVSPGTVHAIGAGVALCEIQQNSDVTYRLFDYGRGRPLHLRQARDVADLGPYPRPSAPRKVGDGVQLLVECPYFTTYSAVVNRPAGLAPYLHTDLLVVLEGTGKVNGLPAAAGQVFEAGSLEWFVEPETNSGSMKFLLVAKVDEA